MTNVQNSHAKLLTAENIQHIYSYASSVILNTLLHVYGAHDKVDK